MKGKLAASVLSIVFASVLCLASGPDAGGGWPQLAGPLRDGTSPIKGVFSGGAFELREIWRRPTGEGFAAPVTVGDRVFLLSSKEGGDSVTALDSSTGKQLWSTPVGPTVESMEWAAASTPATDGKLVFVLSSACTFFALDGGSGTVAWRHDLKVEFNAGPMVNGCWTAPLLDGNLVILQVNGEPAKRVVAFDKASGKEIWSAVGTVRAVRPSPAIAGIAGIRQVIVREGKEEKGGLYSLRATDGALLWSFRFPDENSYSFDAPIPLSEGRIGFTTWSDFRLLSVRSEGGSFKIDPLWSSRDVRAELQPATLHAVSQGEYLYGFGGNFLACLDLATGKTMWKENLYWGSLIAADGHLIVISQSSGLLRIVEATPSGYREKVRKEVFAPGAPSYTPPSFDGRRIYIRNTEEIVALEVTRLVKPTASKKRKAG